MEEEVLEQETVMQESGSENVQEDTESRSENVQPEPKLSVRTRGQWVADIRPHVVHLLRNAG